MMARKRRDHQGKQIVIVVLEGLNVVSKGMAPLCKAIHDVSNPDDEIIVLTLLHVKNTSEQLSNSGHCYIEFLQEEISQRKDVYLKAFRPYYNSCKSNGVKFQVKIAAGFRPRNIIIEEANNVKANWIIMDRCFAKHLTFRMSGTDCNISLVSDDEEGIFQSCFPTHEAPESSVSRDFARFSKSPKLRKGSISGRIAEAETNSECEPFSPPLPVNLSKESENQTISDPTTENIRVEQKKYDIVSTKANILLGQPKQLTGEVIMEIKKGFKARNLDEQKGNCISYYVYKKDDDSFYLIKRFQGNSDSILEAERKAALFLHHKNILSLLGYHKSDEHDIFLVFPLVVEGTLDKHLSDLSTKQRKLAFQDKLNIAMGIAQGIRYMHEECPRGPIAHGELQLSNIFLTSNFQPIISGFEHATWLQLKQESPTFSNRCQLEDSLDHESLLLIKADIFAFGILLLRLFCRRSLPQDDKILIEWARPLLLDRAFHLLLEEDSDDLDMHAIYRVMCAAGMCTISKPIARPPISEVISALKGEIFCFIQSSPSDTSV